MKKSQQIELLLRTNKFLELQNQKFINLLHSKDEIVNKQMGIIADKNKTIRIQEAELARLKDTIESGEHLKG